MNQEQELQQTGAGQLIALPLPLAEVPRGVTAAEAIELSERASAIVGDLRNANGSKELQIIDAITAVGMQAQRHAATDINLLRGRVGEMLSSEQDGAATRISKDLVDLRLTLNRIDPQQVGREHMIRRAVHRLPFGRNRLLRVLETIAVRYEPVSRQVVMLETRLREGRMLLVRDNIELRKLYEQVEAQRPSVQRNAYLGELVMQQLEVLLQETEDSSKRSRIQDALYDVAIRVQDLRVMEEVHLQMFASLELTWQNNGRLGQAVDRTLTLVSNVTVIGLAIQAALARQRRVLEATQKTREYLGDRLLANAEAIKQHTVEIGDVYNGPVIALEKLTQAHDTLFQTMDIVDRLKSDGIASARENAKTLTKLVAQFEDRMAHLETPPPAPSLEA
ncbi:MAG: toxic anion resistance protein [Tepidiformaceae bacterium]